MKKLSIILLLAVSGQTQAAQGFRYFLRPLTRKQPGAGRTFDLLNGKNDPCADDENPIQKRLPEEVRYVIGGPTFNLGTRVVCFLYEEAHKITTKFTEKRKDK